MGHWEIAKEFKFDFGHRVHTQKLDPLLSLNAPCACKHLHGHEGRVRVYLRSDKLKNNMVADFKNLTFFKQFLDNVFDHKMILDVDDPFTETLLSSIGLDLNYHYQLDHGGIWVLKRDHKEVLELMPYKYEIADGLVFTQFVPTSENLADWLLQYAQSYLSTIGVTVSRVQFCETSKSEANFYAGGLD